MSEQLKQENERLRRIVYDCGLGPDAPIPPPELHTLEQRIEKLKDELAAAFERAARQAFDAVQAVDGQPYTTLQKAAAVAATVRELAKTTEG
jgi:hypothetical protein